MTKSALHLSKNILILIILVTSISSCKKVNEVFMHVSIKESNNIVVSQKSNGLTVYFGNINYSIENKETQPYLDKLQKVTLNSFTYKIKHFSGNSNNLKTLDLILNGDVLARNKNITLNRNSNTSFSLEITDKNVLKLIENDLFSNQFSSIEYSGIVTSNQNNIQFEIEINMDISITATDLEYQ